MKLIYFLPLLSINLFAHVDNTIHFHFIEYIVQLIIFFTYICLGLTVVQIMRAVYRRFIWKLKM